MRIFLLLFASSLFISCSDNSNELDAEDLSVKHFPQNWSLYKTTGMSPTSGTTGDNMEWQENYIFRSDNTFAKTRILDEEVLTSEGSYEIREINTRMNYLLQHDSENSIIGNCTGNLAENLYLADDGETLLSNWWACDGPGLFYKREAIQ